MTRARAAVDVAAVGLGFLPALLFWAAHAATTDSAARIRDLIPVIGIFGIPVALAAVLLVDRAAVAARGRDVPERLLSLAAAGLAGRNREWGDAMRAELASIHDPAERRRFAIGCTVTALRAGTGRGAWLIALGTGVVFAVGTYAASRATLAGGRGGITTFTMDEPILVLFTVAFVTALVTRSFRTGLVVGWLSLAAGLVGMSAVAMVEAAHWYDVAGVYLMDGDAPKGGRTLTRLDAILNPVSPPYVSMHLLLWTPWTVLAAAAGAWLRRRATPLVGPLLQRTG